MSETSFRSKISRRWRECTAKVIPYVPGQYGDNGTPDVIVVWNGCTFFCEFKGVRTKLTPLQRETINEINKAGGFAFVCRELADSSHARIEDSGGKLILTAATPVDILRWVEDSHS
jgi:hypothetical protein